MGPPQIRPNVMGPGFLVLWVEHDMEKPLLPGRLDQAGLEELAMERIFAQVLEEKLLSNQSDAVPQDGEKLEPWILVVR